jgi:hypothetical protein
MDIGVERRKARGNKTGRIEEKSKGRDGGRGSERGREQLRNLNIYTKLDTKCEKYLSVIRDMGRSMKNPEDKTAKISYSPVK